MRLVGKPQSRQSESKCGEVRLVREPPRSRGGASRTEPLVTPWPASSGSVPVATRKMVNYARGGRSQGKLWWKPVAVLTCKLIVALGYRAKD